AARSPSWPPKRTSTAARTIARDLPVPGRKESEKMPPVSWWSPCQSIAANPLRAARRQRRDRDTANTARSHPARRDIMVVIEGTDVTVTVVFKLNCQKLLSREWWRRRRMRARHSPRARALYD